MKSKLALATGIAALALQGTIAFAQDNIPPYPENTPLSPERQGAVWEGHEDTPNGGRPEINTVEEMVETSGYSAPAALDYASLAAIAADGNWGPTMFYQCKNPHGGTALNAEYPVPLEVFDNVYSIGNDANNIWAFDTSEGIILLDTLRDAEEAEGFIVGNMMRMGLDPQDIKIIIISHGHGDHTGGLEYLKELTGASVGMSEADYQLAMIAGDIPERDENDFVITDGMEITLGETTLTALLTPGHTPGTVSFMIPLTWEGEEHMGSYMGGVGAPRDIATVNQWRESVDRMAYWSELMGADVIMSNHTIGDDGLTKIADMAADPSTNPYIVGHEQVLGYYSAWRNCLSADVAQMVADGADIPVPAPVE
ncbi:MBL fold metallo-hydrolase [Pseudoroseicyclus sp. H15]